MDTKLNFYAIVEGRPLLRSERRRRNSNSRKGEQACKSDIIAELGFAFGVRTAIIVFGILGVGETSERTEAQYYGT